VEGISFGEATVSPNPTAEKLTGILSTLTVLVLKLWIRKGHTGWRGYSSTAYLSNQSKILWVSL